MRRRQSVPSFRLSLSSLALSPCTQTTLWQPPWMRTVGHDDRVPAWLTRNVRVLSAVSFLQDTASELLYPLLPIYLTAVLGAPPAVVGAVEGAAEGAAAMTKLAAGPLGDRFAKRPLIATGYGMAALGKVMVAAAGAWSGVLAGRVVDRLGKGIRGAPRDALLVADVDATARGRVFGFHRAMDTFGAVVGPLLGLVGYELLDHQIAPLLWVAVVPAVLSVALVFLVSEKGRGKRSEKTQPVFSRMRDLPGGYWRVTAVLVAFGLVNFPDALLLLRLNDIGFSVVEVILAYVTYNAVYALSSFPAGLLADRIGRLPVFGIGLVFFAIGYAGLGLTTDPLLAWLLIGSYGLFTGCTDGVGKAWVSSLVGSGLQGSAQGVFQGLSGFAMLGAGVWAGLLWTAVPGQPGQLPLLISGIGGAVFAIGLLGRAALTRRR
ncbi:MFS transporter [Mycobacterium sp. URHD0025]|uniref:MFS transporter n=1 Tax=Mycobacterium sp. URHD0025 TaxID=1298864 RepID=UPI003369FC99